MLELYWSPRSPFVRKVMVMAKEVGVEQQLKLVRTPVALLRPNLEHVRRNNPLARIPALRIDDHTVLPESVVICEYLDSLHDGTRMFPEAGPERWEALRLHALGSAALEILILWRNERMREAPLAAMLDASEVKVQATLDALEADLERVSAGRFTIGHIGIGCMLGYLDYRFPDVAWREENPRLAAWFDTEIAVRPSFRETAPFEDGS